MKKQILSIASTIVLGFSIASAQTETPVKSVNGGVLNGKATSLAKPVYPSAARAVNAEGAVSVQVVIDEEGNIASATAISGHPLLRQSAEQAALQSKFSPTKLTGQPVRVSGIITYNFVAGASSTSWVKAGYDLASFEKIAPAGLFALNSIGTKIPAEWTSETEQLKQLQTTVRNANPPDKVIAREKDVLKTVERGEAVGEPSGDGTPAKRVIMVRRADAPEPASAEQIAAVQSLTSSLQSRLGSDPKAAWQFNFGVALGHALTNGKNSSDAQSFVSALRQQIATAPADIAPQYLESANKIVEILEAPEKTPEKRQQIGQLLSNLFRD